MVYNEWQKEGSPLAVGTPRVSKPAHGVLLVPPRSLPTHATAPKISS